MPAFFRSLRNEFVLDLCDEPQDSSHDSSGLVLSLCEDQILLDDMNGDSGICCDLEYFEHLQGKAGYP